MACPKVNPRYPDTAGHPPALPLGVLCRRADPDFDKTRRFDVAYEFGRRRFTEDALMHGAYSMIAGSDAGGDAGSDAVSDTTASAALIFDVLTRGDQDAQNYGQGSFSSGFSSGFETGSTGLGSNAANRALVIAQIDAQFRAANGFCDPFGDHTVTTGTGAGGRNPGTVPSLSALVTADGYLIVTGDGSALDAQVGIGAVFYGSGSDSDAGSDAGQDATLPVGTAPPDYVRLPPNLAVD